MDLVSNAGSILHWNSTSQYNESMKVAKYQPPLSLKPTQFAIGLLEAEYKTVKMKNMKPKELREFVNDRTIPVIISPWKDLYVIDRHHFLFACWHADVPEVKVKVVRDYSRRKMTFHAFWKEMKKKNYAYLYDQFGEGPRNPLYLPPDIRGLADDPYRSLVWVVKKEGGFEKSNEEFAEFQWANYFREKKLLDTYGRPGLHRAVKRALRLIPKMRRTNLPGQLPVEAIEIRLEDHPEAKTKFIRDRSKTNLVRVIEESFDSEKRDKRLRKKQKS